MSTVKLFGMVVSGKGEGRKYTELTWVQQHIKEKLGFRPFLGTLNLRLDSISTDARSQLNEKAAIEVCHSGGYCIGLLFKASIAGLACCIVIPQVENYPKDLLEIIVPVNLRQGLRLHDDDSVEVDVVL